MTRRSLRFRLLAASAASISLALTVAGLGLSALFEHHVERRIESQLDDTLCQILAHLETTPNGRIQLNMPLSDPRFQTPFSGLYWQIQDEDRRTLLRSRSLWDIVLPLPDEVLPAGVLHYHDLPGPDEQTLLAVERRVIFRPKTVGRQLRVVVALDRSELTAARQGFSADMFPYLALLGVMLMAAAWIQVRVGLAPLDTVRLGLKSIRSGAARRLPPDYPDEVSPLAAEVNALLDARDLAVERARAWTADLAHGLKTPLMVLSADAQRLRDTGETDLADDLDSLAQTMRQRVDRELIRARIRARGGLPGQPGGAEPRADITSVLGRVVRTLQRTPNGARLDWDMDTPNAVAVAMLPEDLTELLGTVLENAANWAESRIAVRVTVCDSLLVEVEDDGPGVPETALDGLRQRGLRLDERVPGSGLGLAIAQDICDAYGAELVFGRGSSPGLAGLLVTLKLPGGPRPG
jgi:signal transduction histidine kinase